MNEHSKKQLHLWILNHDERWSFIFLYLFLALILSIYISIFWLIVVVALHGVLEWICQRDVSPDAPRMGIFGRVVWAVKLDIGLILFSLVIGVYMEVIMGILGIRSAASAGVQSVKAGARFVIWEKTLAAAFLSLDEMIQVLRAVFRKLTLARGRKLSEKENTLSLNLAGTENFEVKKSLHSCKIKAANWHKPWTLGDWLSIFFSCICVALLVVSPWLTEHGLHGVLTVLAFDLHPWPPR